MNLLEETIAKQKDTVLLIGIPVVLSKEQNEHGPSANYFEPLITEYIAHPMDRLRPGFMHYTMSP